MYMRKRIACVLLTLVMIISMIPVAAMPVFAASNLSTSEGAIDLIKEFEGFSAVAFWDVSQWTIGYGTTGVQGQTITEADADKAMREQIAQIDAKLNEFAARFGLDFTQNQHDALASLSFNCGTRWMDQSGRFRQAVINRSVANEFLYAISLWANEASVPSDGLLKRRLCEANMYINGEYSKTVPYMYSYVILDPNGGTAGSGGEDKMQGYLTDSNVEIMAANPIRSGMTFSGWYTEPTGGEKVTRLNSAVAGRTLYAQYGVNVAVTESFVNVRAGAGVGYESVGTVNRGDNLVIMEVTTVDNAKWGRFGDGWIALQNTNYDDVVKSNTVPVYDPNSSGNGNTTVIASGTVSCNTYVNIRKAAGTNYAVVGKAVNGTKVDIYERKTVSNREWARTGSGWICMDYVKLGTTNNGSNTTNNNNSNVIWNGIEENTNSNSGSNTISTTTVTGTVTGTNVNVRTNAGTANPITSTLNKGTQITVYEQVTKDNAPWGRIGDNRWICLNYVKLDTTTNNDGPTWNNTGSNGTPIATGKVSTATNLNVRTGPGTAYARVTFLSSGTAVNIYEEQTVNGVKWGRVGDGRWVSLQYVKLDSSTSSNTSSSSSSSDMSDLWNNGISSTPSSNNSNNTTVLATGKVAANTNLNVRSGAGTNYARVKTLSPGTAVSIYEEKTVNGVKWGRIDDKNWVCMSYVTVGSSSGTTTTGNGTVNTKSPLNVRSAAGTGNSVVTTLSPGTKVNILEQKTVNGVQWGRISNGWVCMSYISMNGSNTTSGTTTDLWGNEISSSGTTNDSSLKILEGPFSTTGAAGITHIKSSENVKVYSSNSESASVVGLIKPETEVGVYQYRKDGFTKIGDGMWVKSQYIASTEIVA